MASSSSKPTGVHFALIFTCIAMMFLLGWAVLEHKWRSEAAADLITAKAEQSKASGEANTLNQDLQDAMTVIGAPKPLWVESKDVLTTALKTQGVEQETQTVIATLESLRAGLDAANQENLTLKQDLQKMSTDMLALQAKYEGRVEEHNQSQLASETLVQKVEAEKDEQLQQRERDIAQANEQLRASQVENVQVREQLARTEKTLGEQITTLSLRVEEQRERIEELLKTSFETADGEIVSVDNNLHTVYINLGDQDNLRPQVSFSVYSRTNRGIGREARDIKARVEVTRTLGPHLAEAKILDQDKERPISEGDPIYSPVWQGGRTEYFAFVGLIDFDNDGRSDREALHRILKTANAAVEVEVNDEGVRVPADGKITANTKFLVYGEIPDASKFAAGDEKRDIAVKIMNERNAMIAEARAAGVRPLRLSDFLAYIGYKPQQRYFVPGQSTDYKLQNGARGGSVRTDSTGQTSKLFKDMRKKEEQGADSYRN
jgi:hypothetical protein